MDSNHPIKLPRQVQDLTGRRYGRLVVLSYAGKKRDRVQWLCQCDCGATCTIAARSLPDGNTRSCGCLNSEVLSKRSKTHGQSGTTEYYIWGNMLTRCYNTKVKPYPRYGGRGITVCDRWRSFENFFADMGPRPAGLTLDRIDNDGNYEPGNCKWATPKEQARNTRRNRLLTYSGETKPLAEWCEVLNIGRRTLSERLRRGWPVDVALGTPVRGRRH